MSRTSIILNYQPLVRRIAAQYQPLLASLHTSAITLDDLIQEGNIGLITAIDRNKAPMPYIRKFILEALRCHANILTRPCHSHAPLISLSTDQVLYSEDDDAITLADTLPDTASGLLHTTDDDLITPLNHMINCEQQARLQQAFSQLTPREQAILCDLYGLSPYPECPCDGLGKSANPTIPLTIAQTAAKHQLSECNVRQIRSRACHKIHFLP